MPEQTSRIVLGLLLVAPHLIEVTDELNDTLFSGKDKKTFQIISNLWSCDRPDMIDSAAVSAKLGDGSAVYVAGLMDCAALGTTNPDTFKSMVGQLVRKKLTKDIFKRINEQAGAGELDLDEIKPLLARYDIAGDKDRKLALDVRKWIEVEVKGEFTLSQAYAALSVASDSAKSSVRQVLGRMVKEGIIDYASKNYGHYRKVGKLAEPINLMEVAAKPIDVVLPLGLSNLVNLYPKSVVLCAGVSNRGKTALALDFVKRNMNQHKVLYFFKEGGPEELRSRLELHQDIPIEDWKMLAFEHSGHIADVIDPDAVNVYDYLHVTSEGFYKVDDMLNAVHDKLKGGVAFINIQKSSHKELGDGGEFSLRVPRLYITLSEDKDIVCPAPDLQYVLAKVVKAKGWRGMNPDGRVFPFAVRNGWEIVERATSWEYPESHEVVKKKKLF